MENETSPEDAERSPLPVGRILLGILLVGLVILLAHREFAGPYANADALYSDCAAGSATGDGAALERRMRCAHYLELLLANWYFSQSSLICSRDAGDQLPGAYVAYWHERGLGFFSGFFRSAEASANAFFDSEAEPCTVPNPSVNPP